MYSPFDDQNAAAYWPTLIPPRLPRRLHQSQPRSLLTVARQTQEQVQPGNMVLHNPNNWHWVNKDAAPWAKQWFEENLPEIEAREGDVSVKVSKIISMDGDVDVSQRKGKVITIFDVKLVLEYSGMALRTSTVRNAR